jgi:hypothetical protein
MTKYVNTHRRIILLACACCLLGGSRSGQPAGALTGQNAPSDAETTFTRIMTGAIATDLGSSIACAWGDYDNDGFPDLFVTNSEFETNFLYHNNGDGTFTRIASGPPVTNKSQTWRGCAWADYDNDGYLDLIVTSGDVEAIQTLLYHNNGNGTFSQITSKTIGAYVPFNSVIGDHNSCEQPAWADYDKDGFLDLFIARYGADWLFHNDGKGGFTSVTNALAGSAVEDDYIAAWADFNADGLPDLFVSYPGDVGIAPTNRLYLNRGNGTFAQITSANIVPNDTYGWTCSWADYDNDGYPDLFVTSPMDGQSSALYHNNGDGTFTKMTSDRVGSLVSDGPSNTAAWGDYDNDGYLDLYVTRWGIDENGHFVGAKNLLYHNNGDGSFTRILTGTPVNDVADSASCAWADYDGDGFLDLFVATGAHTDEVNHLYRNNGNTNTWLKIKCVGTVSNRSAIGAKVRVKATIRGKTFWQMREISSSGSNQNALDAHFGLGDATNIDLVRIEWPSGIVQTIPGVPTKQSLTVTEPSRLQVEASPSGPILNLKGGRGLGYQIESTTDLITWSPVVTAGITNFAGTAQITDTNAPGSNWKFYRAVSR